MAERWWFVDLTKPRKKHVQGSDFACALWSNFSLQEAITRIFNSSLRYIKRKKAESLLQLHQIFLLIIRFQKSICLVKVFFFLNFFISVFWGISPQVSQQLLCKTLLIFGIFSIILLIRCCHLVAYYLSKPLWNCVRASHICCSQCCSLSLSLSVLPNM